MSKLVNAALAASVTIAGLALAEVTAARFFPSSDPYARIKRLTQQNLYIPSQHRPNLTLTVEPRNVPGVPPRTVVTFNNVGFRGPHLGTPKPAGELRVFLLGGSSTECMVLPDDAALHGVLERELQRAVPDSSVHVRVYNAGKSGDRSFDHVAMIAHRVVHLEPDILVVFAGINDLTAGIRGRDYLHYARSDEPPFGASQLTRFLATEFELGRRVYWLGRRLRGPMERQLLEEVTLRPDYSQAIRARRLAPVTDEPPGAPIESYRRNLETIASIAAGLRIQLVFMTQQTTWNSAVDPAVERWQWMLLRDGVAYRQDLMDRAMESLNEAMRDVARAFGIPLYDLARELPKTTEYFYDDVHFTWKGAERAGIELARLVRGAGVLDG